MYYYILHTNTPYLMLTSIHVLLGNWNKHPPVIFFILLDSDIWIPDIHYFFCSCVSGQPIVLVEYYSSAGIKVTEQPNEWSSIHKSQVGGLKGFVLDSFCNIKTINFNSSMCTFTGRSVLLFPSY